MTWWHEEAAIMESCNRSKGVISMKDELLGEGQFGNLRQQMQFDDSFII